MSSGNGIGEYVPRRNSESTFIGVRGLRYHVRKWPGDAGQSGLPPLLMLHGFMDVAASFQFVVDCLPIERTVYAIDWRGFGLTDSPNVDSYWFADYLGDLDAVIDALSPAAPVDLLGHSMGGNIVMIYAGVRPARVRRLINLEGFGLPDSTATDAPIRYRKWLDQLKAPMRLRPYPDLDTVAARLQQNNHRLPLEKARWLAAHWSQQRPDGQWHLLCDPAHKRINPILYREAEALACRREITAPVLWVEGKQSDLMDYYGDRFSRADWQARMDMLANCKQIVLDDCGHMLHHDQPDALAAQIENFLRE